MGKHILCFLLVLVMTGCATLPGIEKFSPYGGQISNHFMTGVSVKKLQERADSECALHGKFATDLKQRYSGFVYKFGEGGEYDIWNYKCVSEGERNAIKRPVTKTFSGTAFFINPNGELLTNDHVVSNCSDHKIIVNGEKHNVKIIASDKVSDLAILKSQIKNNKYLNISENAPKKLQNIIAVGFPFGNYLSDDLKFTSGIISSLKGINNNSSRLQIDAALNYGNSGGPIVDKNSGSLIAIAVSALTKDTTEGINFGIKSSSVINFLQTNSIEYHNDQFNFDPNTNTLRELLENSTVYLECTS
jgi:S1-C subfamily serine protease